MNEDHPLYWTCKDKLVCKVEDDKDTLCNFLGDSTRDDQHPVTKLSYTRDETSTILNIKYNQYEATEFYMVSVLLSKEPILLFPKYFWSSHM